MSRLLPLQLDRGDKVATSLACDPTVATWSSKENMPINYVVE